MLSLFFYLTFTPELASAAYDWETRTLSDITTMQEMNAKICENSTEHETKQLKDARDSKTYWVTKLKDGNCWMTQNLDYNGGGNKITNLTTWKTNDSVTNTTAAYYDPGNYYYAGPSGNHSQDTANSCTDVTSITDSKCSLYKSINPSDTSAATQELMHYHVGNYYSWNAATNGTGGSITSGEASGSICPDGWELPTSNNTSKGSFTYLLTQYGIQSSLTNGSYAIYNNPLYFVYSGDLLSGQLSGAGEHGSYWSSTPYSDGVQAHSLLFYNKVDPSNINGRYRGFSVRCLASPTVVPDEPMLADNQANVSITVSPVISIDVTQHIDTDVDFTRVARSNIVARVGSNQGYQVLLSTNQSNLERDPVVENQHIPMLTHDSKITAGTSSWGIKKLTSSTDTIVDNNTIYSPVGLNDNKVLFYQSTTPASETLSFPVAIAVDSTLPSGNYSTQITLTAVAN